jgi:hypothetical protein
MRAERARMARIHNQVEGIYGNESSLNDVVNAMIEDIKRGMNSTTF